MTLRRRGRQTIGLTEEDRDLRDSVRGWADAPRHPDRHPRSRRGQGRGAARRSGTGLAEQGLLGLHLPEEFGGAGLRTGGDSRWSSRNSAASMAARAVPADRAGQRRPQRRRRHRARSPAWPTVHARSGRPAARFAEDRPGRRHCVRLSGTSSHVLGGHVGDVFLLAARTRTRPLRVCSAPRPARGRRPAQPRRRAS